jgi:GR25 family glycosyltransferase involved in LPS biosynthesis
VVIVEDDVILANNWQQELQQLILANQQLVLLGWNLDSMLHAELFEDQEFISLFEPATQT